MPETNSTIVDNRDAKPTLQTGSYIAKGDLRESVAVHTLATTDLVGHVYRAFPIGSNERISELRLSCTDSGTTGTVDIGLYLSGGAAVDDDLFATDQALTTALVEADVKLEASLTLADDQKRVWELLGLSKDPQLTYDVVISLTQVVEDATTISLKMRTTR